MSQFALTDDQQQLPARADEIGAGTTEVRTMIIAAELSK